MGDEVIRILLVEDNSDDALLLRRTLDDRTRNLFDLVHAERLDAALKHLNSAAFDVVLLDLSLPDSHGATSPWEINGAFAAFGPGIKKGVRSAVPTSNADLAPTLAHLAGIPAPRHVDGRVLREILRDGPRPESIRVRDKEWQAATPDGAYRVTLRASLAQGRRYVHFARAERP